MRGYGQYGLGSRITRIAEQVGGAAANGLAANYFGVRAAAEAVLAAGGNKTPTAQQIAQAESQVLAVDEPAVSSTWIPAAGGALWLVAEAIDHMAGAPDVAAVGQGLGVPAARDLAEHLTALVRRKLRNVTPIAAGTAPPTGFNFAGATRARPAARQLVVPPAPPRQPAATPKFSGAGLLY